MLQSILSNQYLFYFSYKWEKNNKDDYDDDDYLQEPHDLYDDVTVGGYFLFSNHIKPTYMNKLFR